MARALGIGGVFFKSKNPAALGAWYNTYLGLDVSSAHRSATFYPDTLPPHAFFVWAPFEEDTGYFGDTGQSFMVNLIVDDLKGCLERVQEGGATLVKDIEETEFGHFGWFIDPDGNQVELWQPAKFG